MIRILDDMPEGVLGFEATGKLTAEEYTDVLVPALEAAAEAPGKVRVVLQFSGEFDGLEARAAWQDVKLGIREWRAWERIALVTDHAWMRDGIGLLSWAVPGEVRAFPVDDRAAAIDWVAGP